MAMGKLDLAVANEVAIQSRSCWGWGCTLERDRLRQGSLPFSVAVGDFNGDGKLDLAVANEGSNTVSICWDRDGHIWSEDNFGTAANLSQSQWVISMAMGKPDLSVANFASNTVSICWEQGRAHFGAKDRLRAWAKNPSSVGWVISMTTATGSGVLNLVSGTVSILLGTGTGAFGVKTDLARAVPVSVAVGDFNK